jgi:glutamyl-tRNA reductase
VDGLTLIGVSYRRGGIAGLETWHGAFPEDVLNDQLERVGVRAWALVATCNRWDVVLVRPDGVSLEHVRRTLTPAGAARKPYVYCGEAALEHLARIAASLESLNPGEDQIMRQVRDAYAAARAAGRGAAELAFAFDTALRLAKQVRREIALAPLNTSLFSLARADVEAALAEGGTAVVLGAGTMATLAARALESLPGVTLCIVNRTPERAAALAETLGAHHRSLAAFAAAPGAARVLVAAAPLRERLDPALLRRVEGLRLMIDLGIPRSLDPADAPAGVRLLSVDGLREAGEARREALVDRLAEAESLLRAGLDEAVGGWNERALAPAIRALVDHYQQLVGDALPAPDAERLARAMARVPIKGLRAVAREHGLAAAATFLAESGFARTLGAEPRRGA